MNDVQALASYLRLECLPSLLNRLLFKVLLPLQVPVCIKKGFATVTSPLLGALAVAGALVALLFLNDNSNAVQRPASV